MMWIRFASLSSKRESSSSLWTLRRRLRGRTTGNSLSSTRLRFCLLGTRVQKLVEKRPQLLQIADHCLLLLFFRSSPNHRQRLLPHFNPLQRTLSVSPSPCSEPVSCESTTIIATTVGETMSDRFSETTKLVSVSLSFKGEMDYHSQQNE